MEKTTIELFAGVGGFRVGLNNVQLINNETNEKKIFDFFHIIYPLSISLFFIKSINITIKNEKKPAVII